MQVDQSPAKAGKSRSRLASFASRQVNRQQPDCHAQLVQTNSGNSHQLNCDNQMTTTTTTKELIRQCFLFTNHLLLCTRTKDGKLHPLEVSSLTRLHVLKFLHYFLYPFGIHNDSNSGKEAKSDD